MSSHQQPLVIAIYGPTGVGKTGAAMDLALRYNGEVVNADSRYLYRHLTIGVAKPTLEERRGVRHHLIDVFEPADFIAIAHVQHLAYAAIDDIIQRGKLPILVGGTPLYMNAIVEGWRIPEVAPDWPIREELAARIEREGLEPVVAELARVDPIAAERSGQNPRRVIRALEIYRVTGVPMSVLEGKEPPPYDILKIALTRDREDLYRTLDRRVDAQIAAGLLDEVRGLLAMGMTGEEPAFSSIGYRQLLPVLAGDQSLADAITRIKHDTHRYVRHQMTWLRRTPELNWFDTGQAGWSDELNALVEVYVSAASTSES
jgi:tRNA dimethylallyltransferase